MFLDTKSSAILKAMEMQLTGEYRDLNLESPDCEMYLTYTNASVDRDNIFSTVIDILGKYRTIRNDNIKHFNGRVVFHPAVRGVDDEVTLVLYPRETAGDQIAPRYIDPKRARRLARFAQPMPLDLVVSDPIDDLPAYEPDEPFLSF